jgi:hypothetical protein
MTRWEEHHPLFIRLECGRSYWSRVYWATPVEVWRKIFSTFSLYSYSRPVTLSKIFG